MTDIDQKVAGLKPDCGPNVQFACFLRAYGGVLWVFQTKSMHVRLKVLVANEIKHKTV